MNQTTLTFGECMRRLRRQQKMSLHQLVEKTALSYSHLSRLENDSTMPSAEAVAYIATALDADLKLMLELANCLPRIILDRIMNHDAEVPSPALHRAAGLGPRELQTSHELDSLVLSLAQAEGLSEEDARTITQALKRLISLDHSQRAAVTALILTLNADEQRTSE